MKQSGVPRRRLRPKGQHFAALHSEGEILEHHQVDGARSVGLGDSPRPDVVLWHLRLTITHCERFGTCARGEEWGGCGINAVQIMNPSQMVRSCEWVP